MIGVEDTVLEGIVVGEIVAKKLGELNIKGVKSLEPEKWDEIAGEK